MAVHDLEVMTRYKAPESPLCACKKTAYARCQAAGCHAPLCEKHIANLALVRESNAWAACKNHLTEVTLAKLALLASQWANL